MDLPRYSEKHIRVREAEEKKPSLLQRLLLSLAPRSDDIDEVLDENDSLREFHARMQRKAFEDLIRNHMFGKPVAQDFKGGTYTLR